ncbi:MAG: DUF6114 domain-containing protein, partial [Thermoplasmata archaeon]|nr:DUF6114 domain-containing protein [Thermoplasmata archaeon]
LTAASGLFVILGGLTEAWPSKYDVTAGLTVGSLSPELLGIGGIAIGVTLLILAGLMVFRPGHHTLLGIAVLATGIASLISAFGGLGFGILLAVAGGCAALTWGPPPRGTSVTDPELLRKPGPSTPEVSSLHYRG